MKAFVKQLLQSFYIIYVQKAERCCLAMALRNIIIILYIHFMFSHTRYLIRICISNILNVDTFISPTYT